MNPQKVAIISASVFVFGALFGYVIFPMVFKKMVKKEMTLLEGTDVRSMWQTLPFPLEFKVYLFNYTNPEEVTKGAKPILKEVGPYYYEEWIEKVNLEENNDEDSIVYQRKSTYYFKPEMSEGLTGDEIITTPNMMIIGPALWLASTKPAMLNMFNKAIPQIFVDQTTVFSKVKAKEVLFEGFDIKCNTTEFAGKAVCSGLKKEVKALVDAGDGIFKFSYFGPKNGTVEVPKHKVLRGKKKIVDVGKVIEFDGKTIQEVWSGESCNQYEGTDGTVFKPFFKKTDKIESFSADICRSLPAVYLDKSSHGGIKTFHYVSDLGDLANEPDHHCFCNSPTECPKKGLMDLTKCLQAPIFISLPHFLKTDPSIQDGVIGFDPDEDRHGIHVHLEPISGTPMVAHKRIQFNVMLPKIDKLDWMASLPNTLGPIFWLDEGFQLNKTFVNMLKHDLFRPKKMVKILQWSLMFGGFCGGLYAALMHHKNTVAGKAMKIQPTDSINEATATATAVAANGIDALNKSLDDTHVTPENRV